MAAFERGFKAWADRTSVSLRTELGLAPHSPLPPRRLAEHLEIPVIGPAEIKGLSRESLQQLLQRDSDGWSAVTCRAGNRLIIIFNSAHAPTRQSTDIMHELSHVLLEHSSGSLVLSQNGQTIMRTYNEQEEAEADWLASALLLPREALLRMVNDGITPEEICSEFVVSQQLLRWRLNATGVLIQAARMRHRVPTRKR